MLFLSSGVVSNLQGDKKPGSSCSGRGRDLIFGICSLVFGDDNFCGLKGSVRPCSLDMCHALRILI